MEVKEPLLWVNELTGIGHGSVEIIVECCSNELKWNAKTTRQL